MNPANLDKGIVVYNFKYRLVPGILAGNNVMNMYNWGSLTLNVEFVFEYAPLSTGRLQVRVDMGRNNRRLRRRDKLGT